MYSVQDLMRNPLMPSKNGISLAITASCLSAILENRLGALCVHWSCQGKAEGPRLLDSGISQIAWQQSHRGAQVCDTGRESGVVQT